MSDKSPRQTMTKKNREPPERETSDEAQGKAEQASQTEAFLHTKKK